MFHVHTEEYDFSFGDEEPIYIQQSQFFSPHLGCFFSLLIIYLANVFSVVNGVLKSPTEIMFQEMYFLGFVSRNFMNFSGPSFGVYMLMSLFFELIANILFLAFTFIFKNII